MRLLRQLAATTILAVGANAQAADIALNHVTLTDIEGTHKAFQLGDVDVLSDDGHIASLSFAGAAQFLTLTSVATPEAPIVNAGILNQLRMVADAADGYKVTSLRARGTIALTSSNMPDTYFNYAFFFESPGMTGHSFGSYTSDGEELDFRMSVGNVVNDPGAPFNIHLWTGVGAGGLPPPGSNASYELKFSNIILDIETVPVVPEPSTWMMLMTGLAGAALLARKRKG